MICFFTLDMSDFLKKAGDTVDTVIRTLFDPERKECYVCLEKKVLKAYHKCEHEMCVECEEKWSKMNTTCGLCRAHHKIKWHNSGARVAVGNWIEDNLTEQVQRQFTQRMLEIAEQYNQQAEQARRQAFVDEHLPIPVRGEQGTPEYCHYYKVMSFRTTYLNHGRLFNN